MKKINMYYWAKDKIGTSTNYRYVKSETLSYETVESKLDKLAATIRAAGGSFDLNFGHVWNGIQTGPIYYEYKQDGQDRELELSYAIVR